MSSLPWRSQHVTGENIVVAQPRARRDAGHVIDAHAVDDGSLAGHAGGDASRVGAVILNCLRVDTLLAGPCCRRLWQQ